MLGLSLSALAPPPPLLHFLLISLSRALGLRGPDVEEDSARGGMFTCSTRAHSLLVYRPTFCFAKFAQKSSCQLRRSGRGRFNEEK